MRGDTKAVVLRCPRCIPWVRFERVRRSDGLRLTGWLPQADYVGFLRTKPYEGYKKAPDTCPNCSTPLEEVRSA